MNEHLPRVEAGRLAGLLRDQLHEMMAAAHGLEDLLAMSPKGREYLAVINRGLCSQLRLTRHLELDYRLSSEDEVRLNLRPVELVELCRDLMEQTQSVVRSLGIRAVFRTELSELEMNGDRARLEDMLLCLISNAVKAVGGDGEIVLTLERRGDRVILMLSDDGGGLSDRALAEFFGQREEDDIPPGTGLGLGLSLARRIAALHGGAILADTYEHRGTRLAVALPYQPPRWDTLFSRRPVIDQEGGWNKVLVELSDCLGVESFLPEELDG